MPRFLGIPIRHNTIDVFLFQYTSYLILPIIQFCIIMVTICNTDIIIMGELDMTD